MFVIGEYASEIKYLSGVECIWAFVSQSGVVMVCSCEYLLACSSLEMFLS